MKRIQIILESGSYEGPVAMYSIYSQFRAVRVRREDVKDYVVDMNYPGIYMLLIGTDTVYVGQTSMDTIGKRIMNKHTGKIDSSWHTVLAFSCLNSTISTNELLYLENAMTEYAHKNYAKCVTTSPGKEKCNAAYRKSNYKLNATQIHTCEQYLEDIICYVERFGETIFDASVTPKVVIDELGGSDDPGDPGKDTPPIIPVGEIETFFFSNPARRAKGTAEIGIHLGHSKKRQALLKAGSKVSLMVSDNFAGSGSVKKMRAELEAQGILVDGVLMQDHSFPSQSGAGQFLNGTSFDGNSNWKTKEGVPLKKLLE